MKAPIILIAEDDADDRMIIEDALNETNNEVNVEFVHDGSQLIEYLENNLKASQGKALPTIIILDLNMPKIDGRQALAFVKGHDAFKRIPTIILTTSHAAEDIEKTYDLGVNSFITKPSNYSEMVQIAKRLSTYWFSTVELPIP